MLLATKNPLKVPVMSGYAYRRKKSITPYVIGLLCLVFVLTVGGVAAFVFISARLVESAEANRIKNLPTLPSREIAIQYAKNPASARAEHLGKEFSLPIEGYTNIDFDDLFSPSGKETDFVCRVFNSKFPSNVRVMVMFDMKDKRNSVLSKAKNADLKKTVVFRVDRIYEITLEAKPLLFIDGKGVIVD